jgi:hypothetical protein
MRESDRRLAEALRAAGLEELVERAVGGEWNDYFGQHEAPQHHLIDTLRIFTGKRRRAANRIIDRVIAGDFDGTLSESTEWEATPEAQDAMRIARTDPSARRAMLEVLRQLGLEPPHWLLDIDA